MADRDSESDDRINDDLDMIWCVPGLVAGLPLTARYAQYLESSGNDQTWLVMLALVTLFGPATALVAVAGVFRKEVQRGRMSWEEYWLLLSGISVAACVFLGVTGIDDVIAAWDYLSSLE
ncbi:hypothetical protein Q8791_26970 [Nocardiopsis sp. CT-R113]|uniref:Integral membrane protein n=1 Tax=Nocardiopsis codii TaxID=3065942 RepID=A0ABU7KFU0_9ACTN|nr:hypothetical protein [Nocardiopsis sp. CT-R113]MEE2040867.1 hypothetical protein [Nocardiopsis sp. CT-R113]